MPLSNNAPHRMVHDLRGWIEAMVPSTQDHQKAEVRRYAWIVTAVLLLLLGEPMLWILGVPGSVVGRIAVLTFSPYVVTGAFALCIVAVLPHFFALSFLPGRLGAIWPRQLAAAGACGSALIWLLLLNQAHEMELGAIDWTLGARCLATFLIGGSYGLSINDQQMRDAYAKTHPPACEQQNAFHPTDSRA